MKLIAVILIFLIYLFPLSSAPVFDESIPQSAEAVLIASLRAASDDRENMDISFSDYREEDIDDGRLISVSVSYNGREQRIEGFGDTQQASESSLSYSLSSLMYYDQSLYSDSEYRLEYIYGRSYSMKRKPGIRLGNRLDLKDSSGRIRGVFVVSDHYTDYDVLKPLYLNNPLPGFALEKASSFDWSLDYGISIPLGKHYASFSIGYSSLVYPIKPIVQAVYTYSSSGASFYGGIGISARASISSIIKSSFTLFEEGSISASASVLAGYDNGAFSLDGSYSIYYEHRAAPHFSWRIGYLYMPGGKHSVTAGIGGDF